MALPPSDGEGRLDPSSPQESDRPLTVGEEKTLRELLAELRESIQTFLGEVAKRRMILAFVALILFVMVVLAFRLWNSVDTVEDNQVTIIETQSTQSANGNITRALLCQTIYYDGDRIAPVDPICRSAAIVINYSPRFCEVAPNMCVPLNSDEERKLQAMQEAIVESGALDP